MNCVLRILKQQFCCKLIGGTNDEQREVLWAFGEATDFNDRLMVVPLSTMDRESFGWHSVSSTNQHLPKDDVISINFAMNTTQLNIKMKMRSAYIVLQTLDKEHPSESRLSWFNWQYPMASFDFKWINTWKSVFKKEPVMFGHQIM